MKLKKVLVDIYIVTPYPIIQLSCVHVHVHVGLKSNHATFEGGWGGEIKRRVIVISLLLY